MRTKSACELKHEVLVLTAQGRKQTAVAQELGLSTRTIQRASEKLSLYGDIEGGSKKRGLKGKLHEGMIEALIAMVHYEPSATLSEYAEALKEQFGVTVSTARLCQIVATHDINFKKCQKRDHGLRLVGVDPSPRREIPTAMGMGRTDGTSRGRGRSVVAMRDPRCDGSGSCGLG